jgi:DNA-binding NarL/FixJ family response regulator
MLDGEPDLEVVGEAANGREEVELCRRLHPILVLMDVRMPMLDGIAATQAIKRECPATAILLLTIHENLCCLLEALRAGASGFVLKNATQQGFVRALREALQGEIFLHPELDPDLLTQLTAAPGRSAQGQLTPHEHAVLQLLAKGQTNAEIARSLQITRITVKLDVEHILKKLAIADRTQAAVRASELGILLLPSV